MISVRKSIKLFLIILLYLIFILTPGSKTFPAEPFDEPHGQFTPPSRPGKVLPESVRDRVKIYREIIARISEEQGDSANWSTDKPFPALAFKLARRLRAEQLPVKVAVTDWKDKPGQVRACHATIEATIVYPFIVDKTFGDENEIIIDPNYLTFFHPLKHRKMKHVPEIFVGTRKELIDFFSYHRRYLRLFADEKRNRETRRYSPQSVVEFLYSFGAMSEGRKM